MSTASVDETSQRVPSPAPVPAPAKANSSRRTFRELFCARYQVPSENYVPEMLRRTLYRRARVVAPVVRFFSPGFFDADRDLVQGVGLIRRAEDLGGEVTDYHLHPRNRGLLHRALKFRVSCQRVSHLVGEVMSPGGSSPPGASGAPFGP